jgi:hypothetical protein
MRRLVLGSNVGDNASSTGMEHDDFDDWPSGGEQDEFGTWSFRGGLEIDLDA